MSMSSVRVISDIEVMINETVSMGCNRPIEGFRIEYLIMLTMNWLHRPVLMCACLSVLKPKLPLHLYHILVPLLVPQSIPQYTEPCHRNRCCSIAEAI